MLRVVIGLPGSGKSTFGARLSKKYYRKHIPFYCNYDVAGAFRFDVTDLGRSDISNCSICIDECGIDLNNRSYKAMPKEQIAWFKKYRHYHVHDVWVFSQAFDFDITLRRLADKMYIIKKPILLPWFSYMLPVKPKWDTDMEGQPTIKWHIIPFPCYITFRPRYYKFFNSYEHNELPNKNFTYIEYPNHKKTRLKLKIKPLIESLKSRYKVNKKISQHDYDAEIAFLEDLNDALQ